MGGGGGGGEKKNKKKTRALRKRLTTEAQTNTPFIISEKNDVRKANLDNVITECISVN